MDEPTHDGDASRADLRTRRALRGSVVEGMCHALMLGWSESYLGAFAVAQGHGPLALALLSTLPLVVGASLQLGASALVHALGHRRHVIVLGATLQALSQLGFIAIAVGDDRRLWPLLTVKCVFWGSGALIAPAWGAQMASLTQWVRRQRYFAIRSGMAETALLLAFAAGGVWLHQAQGELARQRFAWMFAAALVARAVSAVLLAWQYDPDHLGRDARPPSLANFLEAARASRWRISIYIGAMMFGASIAIPFFTPHMLGNLGLGFDEYALLLSASILAKALSFPLCHRIAAAIGLRRLLVISGIGVAILPLLWIPFETVTPLLGAQLLGGVVWAGLEYASFQLLLSSAAEHHRLEFLSLSGALGSLLQLAGALCGSWLLASGVLDYAMVFLVSAVLRAAALGVLVIVIRPLDLAVALPRLILRINGVRPTGGSIRGAIIDEQRAPPERPPQ